MPLYEDETTTREDLFELRRRNRCQVCHGALDVFLDLDTHRAFLACRDWHRTHHEGIEREALPPFELNIPTRREDMEQEYGEKSKALAKYIGIGTITKAIATEIVETLWGEAPPIEKTKAILLCQTYQLNPLMRHIYLIGYKRRDQAGNYIVDNQGNYLLDWSMQIGIGATRLMAQRKHNYSYLDMTPRKATQEEIDKILGDTADPDSIYGFVHIKDIGTGAEAFGLRGIPKNERIKGQEKGNTHLNMACIRSERLALDRQYPGEMPQGVEVVDERFIEADYRVVDKGTGEGEAHLISPKGGEKIGGPAEEKQGGEGKPGATILSPAKAKESTKIEVPAAEIVGEGFSIDPTWLDESLKEINWSTDTAKTWLVSKYQVSPQGTLEDVIARLNRQQAEEFTQELQRRIAERQGQLWE